MALHGIDISKYQGRESVHEGGLSFAILNIEDPDCAGKAWECHNLGLDWALYSWLYPGNGRESMTRLIAMIDLLLLDGLPLPPKGGFVDYEQNGVGAGDLTAARMALPQVQVAVGPYTYLYLLNSDAALRDEWFAWPGGRWIAYYPWGNTGEYPAGSEGDAQRYAAMLWQYTSSNGVMDRNVVIDEAAWAAWGPGGHATTGGDDVAASMYITKKSDPNLGIWVTDGQTKRHVLPDEWNFIWYVSGGKMPVGLSDEWWDSIPTISPATTLTLADLINIQKLIPAGSGGGTPAPAAEYTITLSGKGVPVK